jgi:hypothetical protein
VIDPFEEVRLLELHQRLATGQTGSHDVADLIRAGTGSPVLVAGGPSDLVAVDMTTPRTAGVAAEGVLFAATAADVTGVVSAGRRLLA